MFEKTQGSVKEAVGKAQATLGSATGDNGTQFEGHARQAAGIAQQTYGEALDTVRGATKSNPVASLALVAAVSFIAGVLWAGR
ncbi:hypothetical protein ASG35_12875 [Burkholderia sp. Leaf177]|uniref:CsbD family protein n=1 Tax=Burkholderia sp. Leaf177 TaxID=1736287 RepID=UPI0006FB8632|nr:CsbD family protein [Burkholderia sp. Leaf177]KQR77147.1 hypothetical protein ASG35_12875 [Burkholderia sp. Leaf177]